MKGFDYIYYRVCDYYKKKRDSTAEMTGMIVLSLIQTFFIIDLLILFSIIFENKFSIRISKFWIVIPYLIASIYNWKKYIKPLKYHEFRKIWKDEDKEEREIRGIGIVVLIVVEFLVPILYGFIKHNIIEGKSFWG